MCSGGEGCLATGQPNAVTLELQGAQESDLTVSLSAATWDKLLGKAWKPRAARVFPSENPLHEEYFKWSVRSKQKHTRTKGLRQP